MSIVMDLVGNAPTVAFSPRLAKVAGGRDEALFLQQISHWESKSTDGWVFRTQSQIEQELFMTAKVQSRVRAGLVSRGFLKEAYRTGNRLFYKVDNRAIAEALGVNGPKASTGEPAPEHRSAMGESHIYLMHAEDIGYKVGIAANPEKRRAELSFEYDTEVKLLHKVLRADAADVERSVHMRFIDKQVPLERGYGIEWFKLEPADVVEILRLVETETPNGQFRNSPTGESIYKSKDKNINKREEDTDTVRYLDEDIRVTVSTLRGIKNWDKDKAQTISLVSDTKSTYPDVDVAKVAKVLAYKLRIGAVKYKFPARAFPSWVIRENENVAFAAKQNPRNERLRTDIRQVEL